jgi:hypothetical protein
MQKEEQKNLIDIQPLIDITALTLQTGFITDRIDGFRPSSLMFIAKPESGKTSSIELFAKYPFVYYANEITAKTLTDDIFPEAEKGKSKFVLIPDILNCTEKANVTKAPLLQTLKTMVDEGTTRIKTPYKQYIYDRPIKLGFASAITRESLYDSSMQKASLYNDLKKMGFLSRMIPFSYEYPINKTVDIFDYLFGRKHNSLKIKIPQLKTPTEPQIYEPIPRLFQKLQVISLSLAKFSDSYGFRVQKNLQKLCYASALLDGRERVSQKDVDRILALGRWMNFSFNDL